MQVQCFLLEMGVSGQFYLCSLAQFVIKAWIPGQGQGLWCHILCAVCPKGRAALGLPAAPIGTHSLAWGVTELTPI